MDSDGYRIERARQLDFDEQLHRIEPETPPRPGSIAVQTVTVASYPTTSPAVFGVKALDVFGTESEGAAVGTGVNGNVFYATNIGSVAPPAGTKLVADQVDTGKWVFRYG